MHVINDCPRCGKDFMYHMSDTHLQREPKSNNEIRIKYPIQDAEWPSRRRNADGDYADMSGDYVICQDCHEKEITEIIEKNKERILKAFESSLGEQCDILFMTADGKMLIRREEAWKHVWGELNIPSFPLENKNIIEIYPEMFDEMREERVRKQI